MTSTSTGGRSTDSKMTVRHSKKISIKPGLDSERQKISNSSTSSYSNKTIIYKTRLTKEKKNYVRKKQRSKT
jgi:hypothetical protein